MVYKNFARNLTSVGRFLDLSNAKMTHSIFLNYKMAGQEFIQE